MKARFRYAQGILLWFAVGAGSTQTVAWNLPAQSETARGPVYDVVSITPNKSESGNVDVDTNSSSLTASNVTIRQLLPDAYGIREDLISGLPGWAATAHFDVKAKVVEPDPLVMRNLTNAQRQAMLAQVLEDRFHLKVHRETKMLAVYDLVVARSGPRFQKSPAAGDDPKAASRRGSMFTHNYDMTATGISMAALADMLSQNVNRTVIDKTGLPDVYDFRLRWTPEKAVLADPDRGQQADDAAPSLVTAVQEQLGLKLVPAKGPVVTLVVDHVEPPSEN